MSDRQALLDTIIDDPDNDTPRLIFADWLDDHGETNLAEFIRVQCELGNRKYGERDHRASDRLMAKRINGELNFKPITNPKTAKTFELLFRQRDLFPGTKWRPSISFGWDRGFISQVSCTLADFQQHGHEIARLHPIQPHPEMITDRSPHRVGGFFLWIDESNRGFLPWPASGPSNLPRRIFDRLAGWHKSHESRGDGRWKSYTDQDAARIALADAMIIDARSPNLSPASARPAVGRP